MATRREVETKLRTLIKRLDRADPAVRDSLADSLPDTKTIELVVTDMDATYWTEMSGGGLGSLHKGPPPTSDIRVEVSGDHLVELVDGKASLFSSYLAGQVKIQASLGDLMRLRKLI